MFGPPHLRLIGNLVAAVRRDRIWVASVSVTSIIDYPQPQPSSFPRLQRQSMASECRITSVGPYMRWVACASRL